ncbi:MAG TPA: metallophosphoesterase [Candidatus Hydrogenedentes bacterium]|nr:metallophosphoesterase [Candidatus Hydrogenedentota bacterium]HQM49513.1 metallophosphoesterase [Candidatus Hydrogenedentota bacterium]
MSVTRFRNVFLLSLCCLVIVSGASAGMLPPFPEGAFSIVALPDTQAYSAGAPGVFAAEMQWILDNIDDENIVFVSHLGDIVDKNSAPEQWTVAERSLAMLHGKLPYGLAVGNHDMSGATGDSGNFQAAFPASDFEGFDWYGGSYKNNANSWQTFSGAGMDFLILHLECNAPDDVLAWADSVIAAHPGRRVIVSTHMYLGPREKPVESNDYYDAPKGRMTWKKCHGGAGNSPQQMWEKCFSKHGNLFMILSGDQSRTQSCYQTAAGAGGNTVHELMSDYREGYFRVYRFVPGEDRVDVFTYSPTLGKLCDGTKIAPARDRHQFSFTYAMEPVMAEAAPAPAK